MTPLLSIIQDLIRAEGPMTIERYMQLVLHHPDYGYYRHRNPLGAEGDFITAPEVSQMFGETIGAWCVETWHQMGKPDPFVLLEMGPGRGTLLQDLLRLTASMPDFRQAMRLHLLESNATLREIQQQKLADSTPVYIENLEQLPALPLIFFANEFFDTIPMRQFMKTGEGWRERLVDLDNDELVFAYGETTWPAPKMNTKEGRFYEVSPQSLAIVQHLAGHVVQHGGAGLIVDYGYAHPAGEDTLYAVKGHGFPDVLATPGQADVTAEVDFSALRSIAEKQGAKAEGPIGQGVFLEAMNIGWRADYLKRHAPENQAESIDKDLRRLTEPAQMGVWFKAMGIAGKGVDALAGF